MSDVEEYEIWLPGQMDTLAYLIQTASEKYPRLLNGKYYEFDEAGKLKATCIIGGACLKATGKTPEKAWTELANFLCIDPEIKFIFSDEEDDNEPRLLRDYLTSVLNDNSSYTPVEIAEWLRGLRSERDTSGNWLLID